MIASIVMTPEGPMIPVPSAALFEHGLTAGQRVRVHVQPLAFRTAPLVESDGTPA